MKIEFTEPRITQEQKYCMSNIFADMIFKAYKEDYIIVNTTLEMSKETLLERFESIMELSEIADISITSQGLEIKHQK